MQLTIRKKKLFLASLAISTQNIKIEHFSSFFFNLQPLALVSAVYGSALTLYLPPESEDSRVTLIVLLESDLRSGLMCLTILVSTKESIYSFTKHKMSRAKLHGFARWIWIRGALKAPFSVSILWCLLRNFPSN